VILVAAWGCVGLQIAEPLNLILIGANAAALNLVVLSAHTLWINRVLLPRELRPALWREAAVLACGAYFAALAATVVRSPSGFLALFSL
jgi:hypothetical protein